MPILYQRRNEYMIINGWYGKCHDDEGDLVNSDDCLDFDLISAGNNIKAVYWIQDNLVVQSYTRGAPIYLQDFTRLECGGAYIIYLEKGEGQVNIPNFVASYSNKEKQGRISNCYPNPDETPTPPAFPDKITVDSICPMYETNEGGERHCHKIHITVKYETELGRNLNLSIEKSGITQPLFTSYNNVVIGKDSLEFLIKPEHIADGNKLEDVDRIVAFLTETDTTNWGDRITSDIVLKSDWDCKILMPTPTPTETFKPPIPEYELLASKEVMGEGDDLKITLKTKNVPVGTIVTFAVTIPEDFTDLSPLNTFTVNETGEVSIDVTAIEDFQIEGIETLTISLTGSSYGDTEWEGIDVSVIILDTSVPTPSPTPIPQPTPTPTPEQTPTPTPEQTPTPTPRRLLHQHQNKHQLQQKTPTPTPEKTPTPTPEQTPTPTPEKTPTPTPEKTPTPTPERTPTPTPEKTPTPTPEKTPTPTPEKTPTPTPEKTPTPTPEKTPTPTPEQTPTPTPEKTPTPTPEKTPTPTPEKTPTPTPEKTPTPTPEQTPTPTEICCAGFANRIPTTGTMDPQEPKNHLDTNLFESGGTLCYHSVTPTEML